MTGIFLQLGNAFYRCPQCKGKWLKLPAGKPHYCQKHARPMKMIRK